MVNEINSDKSFILDNDTPVSTWGNYDNSNATILCIHGLLASSQWFDPINQKLANLGYFCLSFDIPGISNVEVAKETDALKSSPISYQTWLSKCVETIIAIKQKNPHKPLHIIGNSLGSVITTALLPRVKLYVDKIVLLSPGFNGHKSIFSPIFVFRTLLKCLTCPESEISLPYGMNLVTDNSVFLGDTANDSFKIKGKVLLEVLKLTKLTTTNSLKSIPYLMVLAGNDLIVDNSTNEATFKNTAKHSKSRLHIIDKAYHDLILASENDELVSLIDTFLKN